MAHFPFQIRQLPSALQDFATEMENIVENVLNPNGCGPSTSDNPSESMVAPPLDVVEDNEGYSLFLDLPGVESEGLKVELLEDKLHLVASRKGNPSNDGTIVHRGERVQGKFARTIRLPKQVDTERIEAELKLGVLHIRLPKVPKSTARQIEIRSGN
ncbi:MAG: Hsp20/alpha crystallin family protein [Pirellula sp.]|jgi:HSP20 family protein|nr:Hsp20/alpha crystallin family protein [Pirellula sp.]